MILLATGVFTLSSCLKDKGFDDGIYGIKEPDKGKVVELPGSISNGEEVTSIALDFLPGIQNVDLAEVNIAADQPVASDVKVTLTPNPSLISAYNSVHGTAYEPLPTAAYVIDTYDVIVKKGSRSAFLVVKLNASALDLSKAYALGFSIASASGDNGLVISDNFRNALYSVAVKNKYDGVYQLARGFLDCPGRPTIWTGPFGSPTSALFRYQMITSGPASVKMYFNAAGTFGHGILLADGATVSRWGFVEPNFTFDPATNNITSIVNSFPSPPNGRTLTRDASYPGRWAADKTIYARFFMNQPGFSAVTHTDTLIYIGPR